MHDLAVGNLHQRPEAGTRKQQRVCVMLQRLGLPVLLASCRASDRGSSVSKCDDSSLERRKGSSETKCTASHPIIGHLAAAPSK